jgi:hypothetical protein
MELSLKSISHKEILQYVISNINSIQLTNKHNDSSMYDAYNKIYETAFIGDMLLENKIGAYLCRISKKNGKHRYSITHKYTTQTCNGCGDENCRSHYCRGGYEYSNTYVSEYTGKDIYIVLNKLFT